MACLLDSSGRKNRPARTRGRQKFAPPAHQPSTGAVRSAATAVALDRKMASALASALASVTRHHRRTPPSPPRCRGTPLRNIEDERTTPWSIKVVGSESSKARRTLLTQDDISRGAGVQSKSRNGARCVRFSHREHKELKAISNGHTAPRQPPRHCSVAGQRKKETKLKHITRTTTHCKISVGLQNLEARCTVRSLKPRANFLCSWSVVVGCGADAVKCSVSEDRSDNTTLGTRMIRSKWKL